MLDKGSPIKTISGYAKLELFLKMARDSQSCSYSQAQYPFVKYSTSESEPYIIKVDLLANPNITKEELESLKVMSTNELEQIARTFRMFHFFQAE